jgi:hypothetical protein
MSANTPSSLHRRVNGGHISHTAPVANKQRQLQKDAEVTRLQGNVCVYLQRRMRQSNAHSSWAALPVSSSVRSVENTPQHMTAFR